MVMSGARSASREAPALAVIWHDIECGAYTADLALWLELAAAAAGPGHPARVLDIGAGTGRVALALARAGHHVSAVDIDPVLLGALSERAAGLPVTATNADGRSFELSAREHDLGIVPMQTIQLLRSPSERRLLLERARDHLRPGARLAVAIVTDVDTFDARHGGLGPSPDQVRIAGDLYLSRAIGLTVGERVITIERERLVDPAPGSELAPQGPLLDVIELTRLTAAALQQEAAAIGLHVEPTVAIAETPDHTGSEVVMLRV